MCAGGVTEAEYQEEYRLLRAAPKPPKPLPQVAETRLARRAEKTTEMMSLATELGYVVYQQADLERELANSILTRMIARLGDNLYQAAAYNIPSFPLHAAENILPSECLQASRVAGVSTWSFETTAHLNKFLSKLFPMATSTKSKMSAGGSKALKTKSERVIRVVAHILEGMEISHVLLANGLVRLYVNFTYVLVDETGELHAPKDATRREISLHPGLERRARAQILKDVRKMGRKGMPLSAGWWRQLGEEGKARAVDIYSIAYDVDSLVSVEERPTGRWYLVRWAGYRPEWEAERITGSVGDPVETWEPRHALIGLPSLWEWEEAEDGLAAAMVAAAQEGVT